MTETPDTATDPVEDAGQPPPAGAPVETPDPRTKLDPDLDDDDPCDSSGEPLGRAAKIGLRAKHRAEKQRADTAESQRDTYAREKVERLAAETLRDGRDLWTTGATLADMLGDDGLVDADAVGELVGELVRDRPHYARADKAAPADQVTSDGKVTVRGDDTVSWSDALRPRRN